MITLSQQQAILEAHIPVARKRLHEFIDEFWAEIVAEAKDRHHEGYLAFGDEMYRWPPGRRLHEKVCELADWVNYDSSGEDE